jgi:GTP-binding protein
MFIDEAEIVVKAGDGGNGAVMFRRESGVPRGGPNGGDGGDGGDIILCARPGLDTLLDVRGRHHWYAENGDCGHTKDMAGAAGADLVIDLPPGTLIYDKETGVLLKDLNEPGMRVVIARGGKGGRGNARFASATNQTPRTAEAGQLGLQRRLRLELKLIADVGLVGLPNAGKSTLLSRLSAAHPKIASYPFTTLEPNLGIVVAGVEHRFVMADLPGLIEGAHRGIGLGDEFLRHVERTRVLVHLVEIEPHKHETPADAYRAIRAEIAAYSREFSEKPELVVLTKADLLPGDDTLQRKFSKAIRKPVIAISSATGTGLAKLVKAILDVLEELELKQAAEEHAAAELHHVPPHLRPELAPAPAAPPPPELSPLPAPRSRRKAEPAAPKKGMTRQQRLQLSSGPRKIRRLLARKLKPVTTRKKKRRKSEDDG